MELQCIGPQEGLKIRGTGDQVAMWWVFSATPIEIVLTDLPKYGGDERPFFPPDSYGPRL